MTIEEIKKDKIQLQNKISKLIDSFEEKFDDEVTGWWGDITLWVDNEYNSCTIPTIT